MPSAEGSSQRMVSGRLLRKRARAGRWRRLLTTAISLAAAAGVWRSAAAGEAPIALTSDMRTLLATASVSLCEPQGPDCLELLDEDQDEAVAAAFDADVDARALADAQGMGSAADAQCDAQQTSEVMLMNGSQLDIHATGATEGFASIADPGVTDSIADCLSDSFLEIGFVLSEPAVARLITSLGADISEDELFEPGDPLVGTLWNGAFASLFDLTAVDPKDPLDPGLAIFDAEVHDEAERGVGDDPVSGAPPAESVLDQTVQLAPGRYVLTAGAGTLVFGFENGLVRAGASYDVAFTLPEPHAAAAQLAATLGVAALAAARRRRAGGTIHRRP